MGFKDIFGRQQPAADGEDYVELDVETEGPADSKVLIRVDKLEDYADSDRVQRKVREGNIVIVKIKDLKEKEIC